MMKINKYGLGRKIPLSIARKIRKDAGFGCVICGSGIFEYEHIEPEYKDAKEHRAECMTLLCPTCHGKVTKGILSKETIWKAKLKPATLQSGFSNDWFDFSCDKMPVITFAGTTVTECEVPLAISGIPILSICSPIAPNTPFLLSGNFYDDQGVKTIDIIDNEWRAFTTNWDITFEGPRLTIKNAIGKIVLCLKVEPPNGIVIERLDMFYDGCKITIDPECLQINSAKFYGGGVNNCRTAFSF